MKTILQVLLLTLVGCAIGRQGVYFDEMPTKPTLRLNNNTLYVKTSNSIINSALLIYKINITVDQSKKEIYLSADQAVSKEYKETFAIQLDDYKVIEPTNYSFYWLDPDNKTNKLDLTTEK